MSLNGLGSRYQRLNTTIHKVIILIQNRSEAFGQVKSSRAWTREVMPQAEPGESMEKEVAGQDEEGK